jgi:hypothetical protein
MEAFVPDRPALLSDLCAAMTDQKRLNRYISQMEARERRRPHKWKQYAAIAADMQTRFTRSDEQYAWAGDNLLQYGGSPQEDHP